MQKPEIPLSEERRLQILQQTQLLDTDPEARFDRITRLVQQCFNVKIVLISLVDRERQFLKSRQGLDVCETHRDISFCGHAILADDVFEVYDAQQDARFDDNPLVTTSPFIRFYAGAPLTLANERIGTLCLIDEVPRRLSKRERQSLKQFAELIEQEINDRLQEHAHEQLAARELMYRSVLEGTRIGTWQWNVQTGETTFNERWAEMAGYTLAELAPISISTWFDLAHPGDVEQSNRLLEQHFRGESAFYDCKCRIRHRTGDWIWVHDRGRVISWTDDGKPLMMYGTHADITAQKQAELEIKASRDQFQALVSNIPGITYRCMVDKNWTMLFMSGNIDPVSGYPASDFINNKVRTYASVIHPEDRAWLEKAVDQAVAEQQSWQLQYRVIHKNGEIHWVEERGKADYAEDGKVRFLDGFILDISEEKLAKHKLSALASQLPGAVYQYQQWPDGRVAFPYASNAMERVYGISLEQLKKDASMAFAKIHPEDLTGLVESIEQSRLTLAEWYHEYRVINEDKSIIWLSGSSQPEAMPDGSTLWHGYIQDITTIKQYYLQLEQVNRELKMAQQRLDSASKNAAIGFWQASLVTGELWWSPMIYQLFGFDEQDIKPSIALFKSIVHPDDRQLVEQSELMAQETGVHDVIHRIIRPDGTICWVHGVAKLLPLTENPEKLLVGSVQDVTERMILQQLKDEFIATVSHELRTPLTAIKGALSLLNAGARDQISDKMQKMLQIASSNTGRLSNLINDLLDIEKLTAGKVQLNIQPLHVATELQQALENLLLYAEQYKITLNIEQCDDRLCVLADAMRLQQVLTNLISNAVKFSYPEGTVAINAEHLGDKVQISITDNGIGIDPEFTHRVFERFAQADGSNNRQTGGTGLGLAICKELIEQMQGTISFDSVLAEGSTFRFVLPYCQKPDFISVVQEDPDE
ncbi:PAS domain-containing protein [Alishewanella sp. HL-SH06]|uniref:PAS domain-containing protein n=1 Tax=Alishewanella sp. HL-SH06 TaxID=3461144 RepID=UPI004042F218